jgi:ribosomal-protein-alanine N-acetyltransferase
LAETPIINTDRLSIVPFSEKYLTVRYVSWLNDPEVVRYSDQRYQKHSIESCREYMKSFENTPNYFWAITIRNSQQGHIGNMNAYIDLKNMVADLGIMIGNRAVWKQGYAVEAWIAVCKYLFDNVGIRKITAGALSVNEAMLHLMLRAGMTNDGCRTRQNLLEGKEVDIVYAALFR